MLALCGLQTAAAMGTRPAAPAPADPLAWPAVTREMRPWAYNWWLGSAVDQENLARELRRYRDGGLGGIHVIPIYGVKGEEARTIPYLSPAWMDILAFTVKEAGALGLGVDLTTGSGWCFGGPAITRELAGIKVEVTADGFRTKPAAPRVKRAAPGGEGFMLNPFYGQAMETYLRRFTAAFDAPGAVRPRAMYHDSYEYNGPNWSPDFLPAFTRLRGYDLDGEREAFAGKGDAVRAARVRCDYRETLSDLLLESFGRWTNWCGARGMLTRNQAHGAPGNWLDFYALADIPETEMFGHGGPDPLVSRFDEHLGGADRNPLVSKFASSAAHVAGKPLVSAETGTWLAEHFCETFEELKGLMDLLFLSGVNHIIYHGCVYSPDDAAWPGWLFYASTQMNPRNPLWREAAALNAYAARCQSILQSGTPDNDVLLYWPIHDQWTLPEPFMFTVHSRAWLEGRPVGDAARVLWERGVGFDYVSDRLLQPLTADPARGIAGPGGAAWRAVVVPRCRWLPLETLQKLLALARAGATVVFVNRLPEDVPGLGHLEARQAAFRQALEPLAPLTAAADGGGATVREVRLGQGRVLLGELAAALEAGSVPRETLTDHAGLRFIRRRHAQGAHYFLVNHGQQTLDDWLTLATPVRTAAVLDPLTGAAGSAETRAGNAVRVRLEPGHAVVLRTYAGRGGVAPTAPAYPWPRAGRVAVEVPGPWQLTFVAGGPALPAARTLDTARSWTADGEPAAVAFSGTAVYRAAFTAPDGVGGAGGGAAPRYSLDLGEVRHIARVRLNGTDLGAVFTHPYRVSVPAGGLRPGANTLEVEVTNTGANRLRDLDRRGVNWKRFHDINIVSIRYKPLAAAAWPVADSGLLGPVRVLAE